MKTPLCDRRSLGLAAAALCLLASGCGTTRWSDTPRTATEQLLVSDAVDRSVSEIDFVALAGQDVFLDAKYIAGMVDEKYLTSTLRQHMLASGCVIKDKVDDASFVVEVRAGTVGTNRNDLLFGFPATSLPTGGGLFPIAPTTIPEIPLIKKTAQQGVCKLAVFAYDRTTGHPVWQSGVRQVASKAKDTWFFGAGPFQQGTIYDGTKFAGEKFAVPLASKSKEPPDKVWVTHEIVFDDQLKSKKADAATKANFNQPVAPGTASTPAPTPAPAPAPVPPPAPPPPVVTSSNPPAAAPNPAAGAFGAVRAFDWAKELRKN